MERRGGMRHRWENKNILGMFTRDLEGWKDREVRKDGEVEGGMDYIPPSLFDIVRGKESMKHKQRLI